MPGYIGNDLDSKTKLITTDVFVGDNATVTFTLSEVPLNANSILVNMDGVIQLSDGSDYTVSNYDITFTSTPINNAKIIVRFL